MNEASHHDLGQSEIGRPRQTDDNHRFIQGLGRYVADLRRPDLLHLAFARATHAHARIRAIHLNGADRAPGVAAVLRASDLPLDAASGNSLPGPEPRWAPAPLLVQETVLAVGSPIVAVVADSESHATDAAAMIAIEYDPLPVVTTPEAALAPDAPLVHPDLGTNLAFTLKRASGEVDAAFATAARIISSRVAIPRLAGVPLEPLGVLAEWDERARKLTAWCTTQAPWRVHATLVRASGLPEDAVRVVAPDVGGGFGVRGPVYPEYVVAALAARKLGRAVRWIATRREDFLVTQSSRETVGVAELAATADGLILGLRARVLTNLGAYASSYGPAQRIASLLTGAYRIPAASVEVSGVYTNTGVSGAYRGAGRPEAAFIVERLVEELAGALGIDSIEVRRRNFVEPDAFPYANPLGATYDTGQYAAALDQALALAGYDDLRAQQRARLMTGDREVLGVGLASYVEPTGGGWESGRVRIEPDGRIVAITGSVAHGQGHRATFARVLAERLGTRNEDVEIRQGDTDDGLPGIGTFGSRSTALGGGALAVAATEILERARRIAAHLLEAAPADVVVRDGRFSVVGLPNGERSATWREVAAAATSGQLPKEVASELDLQTRFDMHGEAFAFGTCVAVVSLDRDTGVIRLRQLVMVHDCGQAINRRLVEAQLHGGLAQGAGEALGEWTRYDEDGQLLTGSFLDYWIPHADDLPGYELGATATPTPLNPLGAKGVGEAGTIGAPPAIVHAVLDALRPFGVQHLDLPLSPERIWAALRTAEVPPA
ncbi:MAG: xanthine dehydrogenase family protein molybdopterin-binding subunit [Chloroflexota bacterium]